MQPPSENLLDIFLALDRRSLERLQLTCGLHNRLVREKLNAHCLRPILEVSITEEAKSSSGNAYFGAIKLPGDRYCKIV